MTEQSIPSNEHAASEKEALGKVELAPEVLEVIVGIATTEVEGVADTRGSFASDVAEKFGKKVHGKGIKLEFGDDGLFIDIHCTVLYGYAIPAVAKEIQQAVRQTVLNMTAIEAKEVNVHITGIQFDLPAEK
ncbi:Asp23/Gls24 family envelope stress response protein [Bhargavaea ullalensis]|uniref:Alkaline shock family protein YloU n=1 Tax=Bhargavaea ullalensis TaxID=1265685 RepID=A0ABV2G932_9BACL